MGDRGRRVFVADRENDKIQIFDLNGKYLDEWTHVQRPTDIFMDKDGLIYVASLWWQVGQKSLTKGPIRHDMPGHITVLDQDGNILLRWMSSDRTSPGNFVAPHCLCVDSRGDLYVGEVTYSFGVKKGVVPEDCHTFQKFVRQN